MLSLQAWRTGWLPVPAPTHPHNSHPLNIRSKGLKKLIKRIVKQEAAEQEAERRSVAAVQSGYTPQRQLAIADSTKKRQTCFYSRSRGLARELSHSFHH